jgi:hypothetical protein
MMTLSHTKKDGALEEPEMKDPSALEASGTASPESEQDPTAVTLPPPPDGGLHAWLKVFGGFLVYINIWLVTGNILAVLF